MKSASLMMAGGASQKLCPYPGVARSDGKGGRSCAVAKRR
jgi:hypothetical protein